VKFIVKVKKIIVTILAVVYLATSVGATIHLHYCMGKLVGWSIAHKQSSSCSNCGMPKVQDGTEDSCCKDQSRHVKNDNDQKAFDNARQVKTLQFKTVYAPATNSEALAYLNPSLTFPSEYIVQRSRPPLHIIHCVFRI